MEKLSEENKGGGELDIGNEQMETGPGEARAQLRFRGTWRLGGVQQHWGNSPDPRS